MTVPTYGKPNPETGMPVLFTLTMQNGLRIGRDEDPLRCLTAYWAVCPHGGSSVWRLTHEQLVTLPRSAIENVPSSWLNRTLAGFREEFGCDCAMPDEELR